MTTLIMPFVEVVAFALHFWIMVRAGVLSPDLLRE